MIRSLLAVLLAGLWISTSEFLRNEVLLKQRWIDHFAGIGLVFPSEPLNDALWGAWSFVLAAVIVVLVRRTSLAVTVGVVWVLAFPLMWLVTWNLLVMPSGLLAVAVPWSLLEVGGAGWIARRVTRADGD